MADDGDEWAQQMVKDIEMNGKQANRPQGGMHHRKAGQYAGYVKAFLEFPKEFNKVKKAKTKAKHCSNQYKGWTPRRLKDLVQVLEDDLDLLQDQHFDLKEQNEDLQNQVYHNACLSKSGSLLLDVLDVIGFVQVSNSGH